MSRVIVSTSSFTPSRRRSAYLEKRSNRFGEVIALEPALAKYTRRGLDLDTYWFVQYGMTTQPYQFTKGSIFHLMEPDINQEIYGLPGYLSAIPSALLNESATLFRRKYYINGSHAGFIMYMTDAAQNQEDVNNLRNAMKSAKGPGNFRNLFMYSPNGKKDGLPVAPGCGAVRMHDRLHQNVDVWKLGNQTWSMPLMYFRIELIKV